MIAASVLSFLAFLGLYKTLFHVGWLRALAIAILAVIFAVIILFVFGAILVALGVAVLAL